MTQSRHRPGRNGPGRNGPGRNPGAQQRTARCAILSSEAQETAIVGSSGSN